MAVKTYSNSYYMNKGTLGKVNPGDYYNSKTSGSSSGSSSSRGSVSSGGSSAPKTTQTTAVSQPAFDASAYESKLNDMYAQQQAAAAQYQAQLRAQAESAYNRNMSALKDAYTNKLSALAGNYNSARDTLGRQYDSSKREVNTDAERALREAYVNKMISGRNIGQQLSAQGISGGAAETTLASMQNNYGNARNGIETTRNDNLTALNNTYQDNLAAAQQAYNSQLASAEDQRLQMMMQIESDLANMIAGSYSSQFNALGSLDSSYYNALSDLISKQASYEYQNAMANNPVQKVTSLAQNDMGTYTDYAKWLARAQELQGAGQSAEAITRQMIDAGANDDTLFYVLNQLK